jgi:antitoxin ParD1/3/4
MATMNISLPDQMKEWVERRAASGRYSNSSDVLRDLIREAQDRELAGYSPEIVDAIERAMASRGDQSRFFEHAAAMDRLDAAIEAVAAKQKP